VPVRAPIPFDAIPADRFWARVDKDDPDGCWLYTGPTNGLGGYGIFSIERAPRMAHVISYVLTFGEMPPEDMDSEHSCQVKQCVRWAPRHCELTTRPENGRRSWDHRKNGTRKMPRPKTYIRRTDTKVRLREDQVAALQEKVEETGLSRNRLIEQAIDLLLETPIAPRLQRAPADPKKGSKGAGTRTKPRLTGVGEAAQRASEAAAREAGGRLGTATPKPTRRSPRPRI
jgi:hypothetical protein